MTGVVQLKEEELYYSRTFQETVSTSFWFQEVVAFDMSTVKAVYSLPPGG